MLRSIFRRPLMGLKRGKPHWLIRKRMAEKQNEINRRTRDNIEKPFDVF